jgi:hypothetical protein
MKIIVITSLLVSSTILSLAAQTGAPKSFSSPQEARDALLQAAEAGSSQLEVILGAGSLALLSTGEKERDEKYRLGFAQAMKTRNDVVPAGLSSDYFLIEVGEEEWPFPIPIVRSGDKWVFDVNEGKDEIRRRIVGGNELDVIALCEAYLAAQLEYAEQDRNGNGLLQYAQRVRSTPGKRDGLYWEGGDSPISKEFADAVVPEGSVREAGAPVPFRGYNYKLLKEQGPAAPGGARSYVVQGQMIGGFALLAWPSQYGISGVKSFMVSHDGVVYDKDLGPKTDSVARATTSFNPDPSWRPVIDE